MNSYLRLPSFSHSPLIVAVDRFAACLNDINAWLRASRLRLNPSKTVKLTPSPTPGNSNPAEIMWYGFESATSPRSTFCPQMRGTLRPLVVSEFKLLLTLLSRCCSVLNGIIISFVNFVQSYDAVSRRHHNDHSDVCFFSSWTIATHCCTACDGLLQSV